MDKKFEKTMGLVDNISSLLSTVRKNSIEYLTGVLKNEDGNEVVFDYEEDVYIPCVTYDGGNHPEYAAYPYADVKRVFLGKDGCICLELEEDFEYDIDRLSDTMEVYYVAEAVYNNLNPTDN